MEDILVNVFTWILSTPYGIYVTAFLGLLGGLVMAASVIVPFTKTPKDDEIVSKIKAFLLRFSVLSPKQ